MDRADDSMNVRSRPREGARELVIVACHATYVGHRPVPAAIADWDLKPFQEGEASQFELQAKAGVALAASRPARTLLVFSGAKTSTIHELDTESESYVRLCNDRAWFGHPEVWSSTQVEVCARDSFENLLFSICIFRERLESYPDFIHVVSWGFKAERFDHHRRALGIPGERWRFHGIGKPSSPHLAANGESEALRLWSDSPYGTSIPLVEKRQGRNSQDCREQFAATCPELAGILRYRGSTPYSGEMPW